MQCVPSYLLMGGIVTCCNISFTKLPRAGLGGGQTPATAARPATRPWPSLAALRCQVDLCGFSQLHSDQNGTPGVNHQLWFSVQKCDFVTLR